MKKINNVNVNVAWAPLTAIQADAYVIPQYSDAVFEHSLSRSIEQDGAVLGSAAYFQKLLLSGEVAPGTIFVVASGGGKSTYLFHAACMDEGDEAENWVKSCVLDALQKAEERQLKTLALPPLGCGEWGCLSTDKATAAIFSAIKDFGETVWLRNVKIVVTKNVPTVDIIEQALQKVS